MQNDELRSKLFFIDTNTYVKKNFQFATHELAKFREHLEKDDCRLLITDINIKEIKKHIKRRAEEASTAIKKATKDAMILRNTPNLTWHNIFDKISSEQIIEEVNAQFDTFLQSDCIEIISTNEVNISSIFDSYFDETPPFATRDKKSEFPDAFILHAINSVSENRCHDIYVVSEDSDFKSFCEKKRNLIPVDKIETLLNLIIKNSELLHDRAAFAESVFQKLEVNIIELIKLQLKKAEFSIPENWEQDVQVDATEIKSIDIIEKNIIDVSENAAKYELKVKIEVKVETSVADYDRSPWDPEDKTYAFVVYDGITDIYTTTESVFVSISYADGITSNGAIEYINVDALEDLSDAKINRISYREDIYGE